MDALIAWKISASNNLWQEDLFSSFFSHPLLARRENVDRSDKSKKRDDTEDRFAKQTSNHRRGKRRSTKVCSRANPNLHRRSARFGTARYCSLLLATTRCCSNARHAPEHRHAPRPLRYRLSLSYRFYPLSPTIRLQLRHYGHMAAAHFHFYHSPFKPRSN